MYTADSSLIGYRPIATAWIAALANHAATNRPAILAAYDQYCKRYNLDPNLAIAQACHEATYLTSARWVNENNPAGLGITADDTPPNPFKTPQEGIQAHCEHLCAYAYTADTCPVDHTAMADRRHVFHDGMPALKDLIRPPARSWAFPGQGYVASIVAIANQYSGGDAPVTTLMDALGIIDLRPAIRAAHPDVAGQGAGYTSAKNGAMIHYNGPPTHDAAYDRFISDAGFHQGPYLREKTIAYIYGIGDEPGDGTDAPIYLLRDPDDVCWHCGSWPENATHTPIAFTFGEGQAAGPGQLRAANRLLDALRERDGFGREAVKGHKEVDSTSCPGTLMDDLVYPYRAGGDAPVSDYVFFDQTKHGIGGGFRAFFEHNGGIPLFGYPVTDEVQEKCADGVTRTVQYFERNRFEYHPENPAPNDVQLTRYGAAAAQAAGHSGPGIP